MADERIYDADLHCTDTEYSGKFVGVCEIDGASSFQCFWKIKLPLMMPAFTIGLFLTLTNCFKLYDQNLTLTGGGPAKSTEMLTMDICNTAFSRNMYGMAQAKGIIFLVVVALITVSQLMFTKSKEVEM